MNAWRLGLVLGTLSIGAAGASVAKAQDTLDRWNTNAVLVALQALKASDVQAVTSEGRATVTARTRDNLSVGVYAKACDPAPPQVEPICHGLEAIISFDPGARADRKALADRLNRQFALGKFVDQPDGSIRLSRYVVFDGGTSPANLRANLSSLFAIGGLTAQTLWPDAARR